MSEYSALQNLTKTSDVVTSLDRVDADIDNLSVKYDTLLELHLKSQEYTSFEVFPTSADLPAGTHVSVILGPEVSSNTKISSETIKFDIPAGDVHRLTLLSPKNKEDTDIIIDWGDGEISVLQNTPLCANSEYVQQNGGLLFYMHSNEYDEKTQHQVPGIGLGPNKIRIYHKYQQTNKPYIVKIFGNDCVGFKHADYNKNTDDQFTELNRLNESDFKYKFNLVSRIFDRDLKLASTIYDACFVGSHALRLIYINGDTSFKSIFNNNVNPNQVFASSKNLLYAYGFAYNTLGPIRLNDSYMFSGCVSLIHTDYRIQAINLQANHALVFNECSSLTGDILKYLPEKGFINTFNLNFQSMFYNCSNLTCSNIGFLGAMLWNNDNLKHFTPNKCFRNCLSSYTEIPNAWKI